MMNIHVKHIHSRGDFAFRHTMLQYGTINIATIRKSRGLTQTDLAEMTKLTQPTISRAERGDDSTTMATLVSIAAALDVALEDLFASDRNKLEVELIRIFRQLPDDRQRGWIDMARLANSSFPQPKPETS